MAGTPSASARAVNEQAEVLKRRSKRFALDVIKLTSVIPASEAVGVIRRQLLRAATGAGSNYRSACRSRSLTEFISRIAVALEEADEAAFWLELLVESGLATESLLATALNEANELSAIFARSRITAIAAHEANQGRRGVMRNR